VTSILVVDDDPQIMRVLGITLAAHGYTVLTASDGRTALRRAAECPPAAIVLDCGLPDMDGIEVITQLRRWSGVPIMVFSARSSRADQERALQAGADAYVTKPASASQLVGQLQAIRCCCKVGLRGSGSHVDLVVATRASAVVRRRRMPSRRSPRPGSGVRRRRSGPGPCVARASPPSPSASDRRSPGF
jgi:DNA-binding response OmpR family regulator